MNTALYRKYRSKRLDEIVGQKHVTDILSRSLRAGRVAHAYLLTGPPGVGKTSIARILAHEINNLPYTEDIQHLDIIEIDAASNNGVEDVRNLREKVQIAPVYAQRKVYIIDEVHMLSKAAFNALLKTLEEPPAHAVFILATTDADKLPSTIISRTQRFSFHTIHPDDAVKHLRFIATEEQLEIDDDALLLIAKRGEGSFRNSISLLDQLRTIASQDGRITRALVEEFLGMAPDDLVNALLGAYEQKNLPEIITLLSESEQKGTQTTTLVSQLLTAIRTRLTTSAIWMPLLDQLIEVPRSSQPHLKLLSVLGAGASVKPKTAALSTPKKEVHAPIKELAKKASQPHPTDTVAPPASPPKQQEYMPGNIEAFDWDKLIAYTREHFVAMYSVLSKCGYELGDNKLIIYTGNAFYKKKLDDSKYRVNLAKTLSEIGVGDIAIETIPSSPPPKDTTAAAVAAIMGGGEEVSVDSV